MKKVFSKEKWMEYCLSHGANKERLEKLTFPDRCEGLTEKEMNEKFFATLPDGMVEVNDEESI